MKKKIGLIVCTILITMMPVSASAKTIQVNIPTFNVILNGQVMENLYNQYPLIVYKDITYFPMAYDYASFLGMKSNWYDTKKVLFVGIANDSSKELKIYRRKVANKRTYSVTVPTYSIAVNTVFPRKFLNNSNEEYPVLNFRNVTYFPLTWRFAVDEFGWDYSWNTKNGLIINSTKPNRPVIDDTRIGVTSPQACVNATDYFYAKDIYIGYPTNTLARNYKLTIKESDLALKSFDLENQLTDGDYYFNEMVDTNGYINPVSDIQPALSGNIFSILCVKRTASETSNILLKINIDEGNIIGREAVAAKMV